MFPTQHRHHELVVVVACAPRCLPESTLFQETGLAISADGPSIVREHPQRDAVHVQMGEGVVTNQIRRERAEIVALELENDLLEQRLETVRARRRRKAAKERARRARLREEERLAEDSGPHRFEGLYWRPG